MCAPVCIFALRLSSNPFLFLQLAVANCEIGAVYPAKSNLERPAGNNLLAIERIPSWLPLLLSISPFRRLFPPLFTFASRPPFLRSSAQGYSKMSWNSRHSWLRLWRPLASSVVMLPWYSLTNFRACKVLCGPASDAPIRGSRSFPFRTFLSVSLNDLHPSPTSPCWYLNGENAEMLLISLVL